MKKIIIFTVLVITNIYFVNSQEIAEHTIGVRFGSNNGIGGEISYQKKMSSSNRLEVNLGLRNNNDINFYKLTGVYQWLWSLENNFNWYVGAGAGIGSYNDKNSNNSNGIFYAVGDIGIEYNFEIPLLISIDYRPELGFNDFYDGINSDFALALKYQF